MSASLIEIVQLANGDIVVRRVEPENDGAPKEPMAKIIFSEEAREFMGDAAIEVAKAMIQAGLDAASDIFDDAGAVEQEEESFAQGFSERIVH